MTPRNDIAIYAPGASSFYERGNGRSDSVGGGGAELQTAVLAAQLARRGFRVAHIVFPVARPVKREAPLEIIEHARPRSGRWVLGKSAQLQPLWHALAMADAQLYVFRGGGSMMMVVGAAFCLLHRRRFVLSVSNDFDLVMRSDRSRLGQGLNRLARRSARRVIVQTEPQLRMARDELPDEGRVSLIPSFAEPAPRGGPEARPNGFLWVGRVVSYKLPLRYVELARAVPAARFRMIAVSTTETSDPLFSELIRSAQTTSNLDLMPRQRRETVLGLIRRSTAVVLTSRSEGMPNVFLEAWASGVPVLSLHFDPDGLIEEQRLGIAAAGSWERFVAGANTLLANPELRAELGERARRYVSSTHSPDAVGQRWAEELRDALAE